MLSPLLIYIFCALFLYRRLSIQRRHIFHSNNELQIQFLKTSNNKSYNRVGAEMVLVWLRNRNLKAMVLRLFCTRRPRVPPTGQVHPAFWSDWFSFQITVLTRCTHAGCNAFRTHSSTLERWSPAFINIPSRCQSRMSDFTSRRQKVVCCSKKRVQDILRYLARVKETFLENATIISIVWSLLMTAADART